MAAEEEEEKTYLKSQNYPKSNEAESETSKPYDIPPPKHKETSNKWLVYALSAIVLLSIALLIFGLAVLRITTPSIRLSSVTIKNLHYSSSPEVAINMTVFAEIRVQNKNFGPFKFGDGTSTVLYGNMTIGAANIYGGRIGSREHEGINVTMDVINGDFHHNNANFSKDLDSGLLKLMGFTELRGEVHVMKIMTRHRTAVMNCSMHLNLTSQTVQDLLCE